MQEFGPAASAPAPLAPIAGKKLTNVQLLGTPGRYEGQQPPLTFASLPLSFMGREAGTIVKGDEHPLQDLPDIQQDIPVVARQAPVNWGWYQQGFATEPFDGKATINLQHDPPFVYRAP
jgi:phospholipase C